MAKNVKVVLNSAGVRELLKSDWAAGECMICAQSVASRAGDGFEVEARNYPERTGYAVKAATYEAKRKNLKENTLLKAMGGL